MAVLIYRARGSWYNSGVQEKGVSGLDMTVAGMALDQERLPLDEQQKMRDIFD